MPGANSLCPLFQCQWLRLTLAASLLTVIIGVGSEVRAGSPCIARLMGFEVFLVRFCATPHYIACHEWHELNPLAQSKLVQGIPRVGLCHARKGTRTQMRACVDVHGTHARMCCPCRQTHRCCAWQPSSAHARRARAHAPRTRVLLPQAPQEQCSRAGVGLGGKLTERAA